MRINLDGTRMIFDALRREQALSGGAYRPRVVFTSSIAVFGAPFPEKIGDEFFTTPLTSYGTQKAICELLLSDYSRRGFFDGIAIRLPTICVRPGKPNMAASGFFSNIIREPLNGEPAVLPVEDDVRHHHASPRAAIGFLLHAASLDLTKLGARRALTMPGVSVTVAEQIEALRRIGGDKAVALIRREPNETIRRIVAGWPRQFDARRARGAGVCGGEGFRRHHPRPYRRRAWLKRRWRRGARRRVRSSAWRFVWAPGPPSASRTPSSNRWWWTCRCRRFCSDARR